MTAATKPQTVAEEVAARFAKEIANHVTTVKLDSGIYRHLFCREPNTSIGWFQIVTYPGELVISGDMGTFVFRRLHDMFAFFRAGRGEVNLSYWSEKLEAHDRVGVMKFDPDKFESNVKRVFYEWLGEQSVSDETASAWLERVEDEVISCAHDGEFGAIGVALNFEIDGETPFSDLQGSSQRDYSPQFVWCCHAIVWAIAQYDAVKAMEEPVKLSTQES